VTRSPLLPLARSPVGDTVGRNHPAAPASRFVVGPGATGRVEVPITPFFAALAADTTAAGAGTTESPGTLTLALLGAPLEGSNFGFAEFFGRRSGANAPRLRLIVTVATEVQLP
jgi:hypothetical protein